MAGISNATFMQFLAIKCFEVLKRLRVRQDVGDGAITEVQFRQSLARAESECAEFIEHAYQIAQELAGGAGEVPE